MVSRRWILYSFHFSICLILGGLTLTLAQEDFWAQYCFESDNYTQNSAYRQSLDDALFGLTGTDNGYGFYNYSSGRQESQDHDLATAVALCRGDIPPDTCRRCVDDATRRIRQVCPVEKAATGWYDFCVLRYSNHPILNTVDHEIVFTQSNLNNVESVEQFNQTLSNLLDWLRGEAARGDSIRKYAAGTRNYTNGSGNSIIYGFMQCTPDLSESQCSQCLQAATEFIPVCCDRKEGGRVYGANCILRYEVYPFYNETWYPPLPILPAPGKERKSTFKLIFVPIAAAAVLTCVLVFLVCHSLRRKWRPKGKNVLPEVEAPLSNNSIESSKYQIDKDDRDEMNYFNLNTIQAATNNFSAANKLGEGGFGPQGKGTLPDGKEIAVKRLSRNSGQGLEEFTTEVRLIIKLQHKNLVRILGCCLKGSEKLLVYEYMANTSLDAFLFDPKKRKQLDWLARVNIVIGIAKGLRYLHEDSRLKIVHRDMKASNILLDDEMNPKISDFGTARIFGGKQIEASTNRVVGTYGYMAPEYAMEGLFSTKSDVYSFGVLLLEIISGKKNSGFHHQDRGQLESLLSYAWCLWKDKKGEQLIDESLIGGCPVMEALRWINVALLCVQEDPTARPNMSSVVFMLEGQTASLPQPSVPPFSVVRLTFFDQASTTGMQTVTLVSGRSSTTCTDTASTAPDQSEFRRNETS